MTQNTVIFMYFHCTFNTTIYSVPKSIVAVLRYIMYGQSYLLYNTIYENLWKIKIKFKGSEYTMYEKGMKPMKN